MKTRDEVCEFFAYAHLPEHLQEVSEPFFKLATLHVYDSLKPTAERTLALRKLWEAKNYAVYAAAQQHKEELING